MAYLGNGINNYDTRVELRTDVFSANGSANTFTLSYSVARPQDIEVVANGDQKNPFDGSYSVSGANLTFTVAPSAGSNNIYVVYRDFFQVTPFIGNQTVITEYIASQAVTTEKLGNHSVTSLKMANNISLGNTDIRGTGTVANTFTLNTRATSANHATQKQYVDALTIVFGA